MIELYGTALLLTVVPNKEEILASKQKNDEYLRSKLGAMRGVDLPVNVSSNQRRPLDPSAKVYYPLVPTGFFLDISQVVVS